MSASPSTTPTAEAHQLPPPLLAPVAAFDDDDDDDAIASPSRLSAAVEELGKRLSRREDRAELVRRNILPSDGNGTVSASLLQARAALERGRAQAQLDRRLSLRPTRADLKLRNILRVESNETLAAGGGAFGARREVVRSILKRGRPPREALEERNILKVGSTTVAPALAAAQSQLRRAQLQNTLEARLRDAPPSDGSGLHFSEKVRVSTAHGRGEYDRRAAADAAVRRLTPQTKAAIRAELNAFKRDEMQVHEDCFVLWHA
ncbi:hypothetical protein HK405_014283, partial [Cladochytrium tenue]